ncbi:MAG: transglycosylase SLT domain-containing protein [Hyphomicrobiales bacterium]
MAVGSTTQMPIKIETALRKAAAATGVDFQYLVDTAKRESGFRPSVKAPTSSASGLFQFIESTWLQMVKEKGPELGLTEAAAQITKTSSGKYRVEDPATRREILELRNKPEVAALMAGAFTQLNAETIEAKVGRKPTSGELYIAHFLGAHNGSKLIHASSLKPDMKAADLFPQAANSNKSLFYKSGNPVSVKGLYHNLVRRHSVQQIDVAQNKQETKIAELEAVKQPVILQGSADYQRETQNSKSFEGEKTGNIGQIFHQGLDGTLFTSNTPAVKGQKTHHVTNGIEGKIGRKKTVALASNINHKQKNDLNHGDIKQSGEGRIGVWGQAANSKLTKAEPYNEKFAVNNAAKQKPILELGEDSLSKAAEIFRKGGLG